MLLLNRNIGETIIIDGDVRITVMEVSGNQIRIGIDAPKNIKVYRNEIFERMQAEADSDKDAAELWFKSACFSG